MKFHTISRGSEGVTGLFSGFERVPGPGEGCVSSGGFGGISGSFRELSASFIGNTGAFAELRRAQVRCIRGFQRVSENFRGVFERLGESQVCVTWGPKRFQGFLEPRSIKRFSYQRF